METKIPLTQLWVHQPEAKEEASLAIGRVLDSGKFILGEEVEAFEREFSQFLGVPSGVGVASGTDAITLALLAGGIGAGDEVLVPAFAPGATASGILAAGAIPVLVDVSLDFCLDLAHLQAALSSHTRALVIVHFFGGMDAMTPLLAFAKTHNLWVVEDCAHAHGALYWSASKQKWCSAGTLGDASAFSFYPTKNLGAIGDGGFCCSSKPEVVELLRNLRQYGWRTRDNSERAGRNSRLDEVQAAVLRVALPRLHFWNTRRRSLAGRYLNALASAAARSLVTLPNPDARRYHVFHQFVVRSPARDVLASELTLHGVGYGIHYPKALSQQAAYQFFGRGRSFPVAERLAGEVLSLPVHPWLSAEAAFEVISILNRIWRKK
jgi:dTDP-4-amino-4,6-dideoxygalactose transaminase